MKFQSIEQVTHQSDKVVLTDMTKMENRCQQSLEKLEAGEKVIVVFRATVGSDGIGLESPTIVKEKHFPDFMEKFMPQFIQELTPTKPGADSPTPA